jgi:phosphatidylserine/phosphatidylglycerophosphate/cardiolipin synthase-like enzyme
MSRNRTSGPFEAHTIELVSAGEYYRLLPKLFRKARKSIHVCMFHIAMPSSKHPTRRILRSLVAARKRGLSVRVLVDYDRKRDPYLSRVVNKPAMDYLRHHQVNCRYDKPEKLLHSKFVTVDGMLTVVGSHNWSAGSYFRYGDISFSIHSAPYTRQINRRFRALWQRGWVPPAS